MTKRPEIDLQGHSIIVVDDVIEGGRSLGFINRLLQDYSCQSIRFITLLQKKEKLVENGFKLFGNPIQVDDFWLIGCGMDEQEVEETRNLPKVYRKVN